MTFPDAFLLGTLRVKAGLNVVLVVAGLVTAGLSSDFSVLSDIACYSSPY